MDFNDNSSAAADIPKGISSVLAVKCQVGNAKCQFATRFWAVGVWTCQGVSGLLLYERYKVLWPTTWHIDSHIIDVRDGYRNKAIDNGHHKPV